MLSVDRVKQELDVYFLYYQRSQCGSGFARQTSLGRMASGDVGGGVRGVSLVPVGVEMTDTEYLQLIQRVDLAMVALHTHNARWRDYVACRYGLRESICVLMERFGICNRSCLEWQRGSLLFLSERI